MLEESTLGEHQPRGLGALSRSNLTFGHVSRGKPYICSFQLHRVEACNVQNPNSSQWCWTLVLKASWLRDGEDVVTAWWGKVPKVPGAPLPPQGEKQKGNKPDFRMDMEGNLYSP